MRSNSRFSKEATRLKTKVESEGVIDVFDRKEVRRGEEFCKNIIYEDRHGEKVLGHNHYLPEEELRYISKKTGIPITQIYSIVNFYNRFSLKPKGKNEICVCLGTACHVKGAEKVMNEMERVLEIKPGESTDDMNFSLEEVRCIGACSLAPAVVVNEDTPLAQHDRRLRDRSVDQRVHFLG